MKLVHQPKGSNTCGQSVVAMLLGVSLEEAIQLMGTRGQTTTKQLVKALQDNGIWVAPTCKPSHGIELPRTCILKAHKHVTVQYHWMLKWKGKIYDPARLWYKEDYVIFGYIPVWEEP